MIYFIVNPAAGNGKSRKAVPIIERIANERSLPYRIVYTVAPGEAKSIVVNAAKDGASAVVSVGGDGTVQEIVTGLVESGSSVPLGIVPAGSGNDLYCSIHRDSKLPGGFDRLVEVSLSTVLDGVAGGKPKPFDAIKMGDEYFLNIGSVGLDAFIVKDAAGLKKMFGRLAYVVSTVKNSLTYNAEDICVTVDGRKIEARTTLIAVCNGTFYGGGFRITPSARMDDGLITVCHIKYLPKIKVLMLFPAVLLGKHTNFREVSYIDCKHVSIEKKGGFLVNLDGNLLDMNGKLEFSIIPGGVNVFV